MKDIFGFADFKKYVVASTFYPNSHFSDIL